MFCFGLQEIITEIASTAWTFCSQFSFLLIILNLISRNYEYEHWTAFFACQTSVDKVPPPV